MINKLSIIPAYLMVGALLFSCTKEPLYLTDPEDIPDTSPLVTVIYDPDALGDRSYNDLIYSGVEEAAKELGLRTMQLSPSSMEEGIAYLETVFTQMPSIKDTVRRLFIVASPAYDDYLRKNNRRLEAAPNASLLYLETSTPLEGKGSTLHLPYYGAMYEAGVFTSILFDKTLLVGANPKNESVTEAMGGFRDGYTGSLTSSYLGESQEEGFSVADSVAIKLLYPETGVNGNPMVVPVCGGSGRTIYRMVDILGQYCYMSIDTDISSPLCPISAVKHIDWAVALFIRQWLTPEGMPKHILFTLESGYTEVILHDWFLREAEQEGKPVTDAFRSDVHRMAIEKEAEYAK